MPLLLRPLTVAPVFLLIIRITMWPFSKSFFSLLLFFQLTLIQHQAQAFETQVGDWRADVYGTVRVNYIYLGYVPDNREQNGELKWDVGALGLKLDNGPWQFNVSHRWYEEFNVFELAYLQYDASQVEGAGEWTLQAGLVNVPFGLQRMASNNFWASANNALGFEEDNDVGFRLEVKHGNWTTHAAYYLGPELPGGNYDSYSYDLGTSDFMKQYNEEQNQLNWRQSYRQSHEEGFTDWGYSLQVGEVANSATRKTGSQYAAALHTDSFIGQWHIQSQWFTYHYDLKNPAGVSEETVLNRGFTYPFLIAATGQSLTFNVARRFDTGIEGVSYSACYHDYSKVFPDGADLKPSTQAVLGCRAMINDFYVFADWISGKNMIFAGGYGVGSAGNPNGNDWEHTLNLNIGYYF